VLVETPAADAVGFVAEEIDQDAPTRAARLKWVVVVDQSLPAGRAVNAAICVAAATSDAVGGILGDPAVDADGTAHPGLPWAGCSVLAADAETLRALRAKAVASAGTFVADMPAAAQHTRVYSQYLNTVGENPRDALDYCAVSIVGPRNRVDKIVKRLPLMA
jgi:hypothetical protein